MELIALGFLFLTVTLYTISGGADFGAGVFELLSPTAQRRKYRALVSHALGPVWEANHVWLIFAIVVLFTAFPRAYALLSTAFHIPLTIMLVGITLRGCAFVFRNYDAYKDDSQELYSAAFGISSVLTPLSQGMIAGGLLLGRISTTPTSFYEGFIAPWFNLFSLSVGVFLVVLATLLASVFLISEEGAEEVRGDIVRTARFVACGAVPAGLMVFFSAHLEGLPLAREFATNPVSISAMATATLLLWVLLLTTRSKQAIVPRACAAGIVTCILTGWWAVQYPYLAVVPISDAAYPFTIHTASAPESALRPLVMAYGIGAMLVIPALLFLFRTFKRQS